MSEEVFEEIELFDSEEGEVVIILLIVRRKEKHLTKHLMQIVQNSEMHKKAFHAQ